MTDITIDSNYVHEKVSERLGLVHAQNSQEKHGAQNADGLKGISMPVINRSHRFLFTVALQDGGKSGIIPYSPPETPSARKYPVYEDEECTVPKMQQKKELMKAPDGHILFDTQGEPQTKPVFEKDGVTPVMEQCFAANVKHKRTKDSNPLGVAPDKLNKYPASEVSEVFWFYNGKDKAWQASPVGELVIMGGDIESKYPKLMQKFVELTNGNVDNLTYEKARQFTEYAHSIGIVDMWDSKQKDKKDTVNMLDTIPGRGLNGHGINKGENQLAVIHVINPGGGLPLQATLPIRNIIRKASVM